jgi:hypothetical protein
LHGGLLRNAARALVSEQTAAGADKNALISGATDTWGRPSPLGRGNRRKILVFMRQLLFKTRRFRS